MNRRIGAIARIPILAITVAAAPLCASLADPLDPDNAVFAGLLGYDFTASDPSDVAAFGVMLDVTLSDGWGAIHSTVAARGAADETHVVRLDSALTRELGDEPLRVTFGDAILEGGDWAIPVRFGGITIEPIGAGAADPVGIDASATTLGSFLTPGAGADRYVGTVLPFANAVHRGANSIAPAPFPVGSGRMDFAVSDAPPPDQLAALPTRSGLPTLRQGETDNRVELGLLRRDYGVGSFDYGDPVGAATLRYGITDALTGETHGEATPDTQAAGLALGWAMDAADQLTLSSAASNTDAGGGLLGRVSLGHAEAGWDASLSYQMATDGFAQPGQEDPADRATRQAQASAGIELGDFGDLTLGYSLIDRADASRDEVAAFAFDLPLVEDAHLVALGALSRTDGSASVGFSLTIPLGGP
jgi:outer membrane usher protein